MDDNVAKVKVTVSPDISKDGEIVTLPSDVLYQAMADAGWSEDPGTGKAILTPLGSEIVSPRPVAPPIGYVHEESIMERLDKMLTARLAQMQGDNIIDETEEDLEDFDVPDLEDVRFSYTLEMLDEAPSFKGSGPVVPVSKEEATKAALDQIVQDGNGGK